MVVEPNEDDYKNIHKKLSCFIEAKGLVGGSDLDVNMFDAALKVVSDVSFYADFLGTDNIPTYTIQKDGLWLQGVTIEDLALFAASELRLMRVEKFVRESFTDFTLRERQDSRVRYEISDENLKISSIFAKIEEQKQLLHLADYSVSQTSLEQVFNIHAAQAEQQKIGRIDHDTAMDCETGCSTRSIETMEGLDSSHAADLQLYPSAMENPEHDRPYDENTQSFDDESRPFDERCSRK